MVKKIEHSISKHVFYASQIGAKLDSDVINGGGTDDTEALQAVLNMAPELGSLHLILDGPALVHGLSVHSNTTIECLNSSCGFFLISYSNRSILRNARPNGKERQDKNITLLGGTYNHNSPNQLHHTQMETRPSVFPLSSGPAPGWTSWHIVTALEFFGVENLTIRDVTIRNQKSFAIHMTNWYRVNMENISIDCPEDGLYREYKHYAEDRSFGSPYERQHGNQDGIHIQGPGQFLTMRNIQGNSWDDFIALNADDGLFSPWASTGDITDVLIDGVFFNNALQGIRLLSVTSRLDRVVIKNVTGTYRWYAFFINPWIIIDPRVSKDKNETVYGNFGNIIFDTIDVRQTESDTLAKPWPPFLFHVGGKIESLTLCNISHHQPIDNRKIFQFERDLLDSNIPDIKSLIFDGLHIYETNAKPANISYGLYILEKKRTLEDASYILLNGFVDKLIVRNVEIIKSADTPQKGCLIETIKGAKINDLFMNGVYANRLESLLSHQDGSIGTLQLNNILCSEVSDAAVSVKDGNIQQLNADAVHGCKLVSVNGNGKVGNS